MKKKSEIKKQKFVGSKFSVRNNKEINDILILHFFPNGTQMFLKFWNYDDDYTRTAF